MPSQRLKKFLDDRQVRYLTVRFSPAYTAQQVAAASHIPGKQLAKTVIVKLDDKKLAMAVLPAPLRVDLERLSQVIGHKATLASEDDYADAFPGCEVGAMPPFGRLWNMEVYADESLLDDEQVAFLAGSHSEAIVLMLSDYSALAEPRFLSFAKHR